jgi:glycosyltransferase involved in cell wall biosynthesis
MSAHAAMAVYFIVPDAVDDPRRVSGGNVYDQHVRDGLRGSGWDVRMLTLSDDDREHAARVFSELPDGCLVLVDGLVAVRESQALLAHSERLRIVVLAHMVASSADARNAGGTDIRNAADAERRALRAATRVITTSGWTRAELISRDLADLRNVVVARPGTDQAAPTTASPSGGRVLCVGVVAPHKGQDLLIDALARLTDVDNWTCTLVGSIDAAPSFVSELAQTIRASKLPGRMTFTGPLAGSQLDAAYGWADLVVVPSRTESFGMVVAEALARGIPVLAARVGGIPEAMHGSAAGILVPPEDAWALEVVLRQWWASRERRRELRAAAMQARGAARPWSETVAIIASTLHEVASAETRVSA